MASPDHQKIYKIYNQTLSFAAIDKLRENEFPKDICLLMKWAYIAISKNEARGYLCNCV